MSSSPAALGRPTALEATLVGAFALLPLATAAEPSAAYVALARLYARGERAAAVAQLSEWTPKRLDQELEQLRAGTLGPSRGQPAGSPLEVPLRAVIMLHTDRDAVERGTSASSAEPPRCGTRTHMELALGAATLLVGDPKGREFSRRWTVAMALRALAEYCFDDARRFVHDGLKWVPRDAELVFVGGIIDEAVATLMEVGPTGPVAHVPSKLAAAQRLVQDRLILLGKARHAFEQAIAGDGTLLQARLHLGRVAWRLEDREGSRAALAAVLAGHPPPDVGYLAHLFLGKVDEDEEHWVEAEMHYRAALSTDPSAQAAAIALSHVLQHRGEADDARAVIEAALLVAGRRNDDLFWGYLFYRTAEADRILDGVRAEAVR